MAFRFATVTNGEIVEINEEAVPANTKKATKFGLANFLQVKLSLLNPEFIDETGEKVFVYKCKLILRDLILSYTFIHKTKFTGLCHHFYCYLKKPKYIFIPVKPIIMVQFCLKLFY